MTRWPFRRRKPCASEEAVEQHEASLASLADARALRKDAAEVSSDLRERREINHWASGFRIAMGGPA